MKTIIAELGHVEIELPDGWYRVLSGSIKPGDRRLDVRRFRRTSEVRWRELKRFPRPTRASSSADWYVCLIRRGEPVDALCPRCHDRPVRPGYRYCVGCCFRVVRLLRRQYPPCTELPAESAYAVLEWTSTDADLP